ncbi:MAG: hypothetical protein M1832_001982 [Thelocarpon impressellum]|nr:MAG: hypothetical protein M1832_001982 [Thelocarpon impressellum]
MPEKRPLEEAASGPQPEKKRKGFSVGPDNLPDGTHRRKGTKPFPTAPSSPANVPKKVQKIKKNLIRAAKVKRSYAKLKDSEPASTVSEEIHPERRAMLDTSPPPAPVEPAPRRRKEKPQPFRHESDVATRRAEAAAAARAEREEGWRQRETRLAERERFRKAMARARRPAERGGRKLGRESTVLLERVRRIVGEG